MNLGAAMAVVEGRGKFDLYVSCSLQQLRQRHLNGSMAVSHPGAPSPVPAVAVAQHQPPPQPHPQLPPTPIVVQAAPPPLAPSAFCLDLASSASQEEQSVDFEQCAKALLELKQRKRIRQGTDASGVRNAALRITTRHRVGSAREKLTPKSRPRLLFLLPLQPQPRSSRTLMPRSLMPRKMMPSLCLPSASASCSDDDDVFYLFLQKQK